MKVAIPISAEDLNAPMETRFGRSRYFLIYDHTTNTKTIEVNSAFDSRGGAGIKTSEYLISLGVTDIISPEVGPNALRVLQSANISIYLGEDSLPSELIQKLLDSKLQRLG